MSYTFDALKTDYLMQWNRMAVTHQALTIAQCREILTGKARYLKAQAATGVPWFVIGILHARESGLPPDWKACLHNGERIIGTGQRTHLVPAGRGPFATWQDAAVDALELSGLDEINWGDGWGPEHVAYALERYNGFGYRQYHNVPSPYVWGGTNIQKIGKYNADGHYDSHVWDTQIGGMALLRELMKLDNSVVFKKQQERKTEMAHLYKLGRMKRLFLPQVPHLSSWLAATNLPPIPVSVDYTHKMDPKFGMMLNDRLGCCTCSAFYHARQVWSANVPNGHELTDPDKDVLRLYEWAAGYNPADPSTDQGAVCQNILKYIQHHGAPVGKAMHWDRILAFVEVDVRNIEDVKRVINDCGVAYIGFDVPSNIMPPNAAPPTVWTVEPGATWIGGHCVVLAGYNSDGAHVISWGQKYFMTWEFFTRYTEESYGIVDKIWFDATGHNVLGMTASMLEQQMAAINTLAA